MVAGVMKFLMKSSVALLNKEVRFVVRMTRQAEERLRSRDKNVGKEPVVRSVTCVRSRRGYVRQYFIS